MNGAQAGRKSGGSPLSLEYFEGAAGCGKTHQMIEALQSHLDEHPLSTGEMVLGITYMHGSRRRMHSRLVGIPVLKGRFLAATVDSVARSVVWRWRTLVRSIAPDVDLTTLTDFDVICRLAAVLLSKEVVASWFCSRYPVVLADELQDCKGDRLGIIQAIEPKCCVIAAADEFQDLRPVGANAAVAWLHASSGKRTTLTANQRTRVPILLKAANELRASRDCADALGGKLVAGFNANSAAGCLARSVHWGRTKDVVILTPTGPEKSPFVHAVVERLTANSIQPKGIEKPLGPYRIVWESNAAEERTQMLAKVVADDKATTLDTLHNLALKEGGAHRDLYEWAERKHRIKGVSTFTPNEICEAVERLLQARRSFLPATRQGVIHAMTISQAKNREFEGVIILWPLALGGDLDSRRRLLYNALTRAKLWATVIVQETKMKPQLSLPPFSRSSR